VVGYVKGVSEVRGRARGICDRVTICFLLLFAFQAVLANLVSAFQHISSNKPIERKERLMDAVDGALTLVRHVICRMI
jgi:hypothetical protein